MRHRQAGFTLVELLVVIAIIGTLVALLLPAVNAAREASRRTTCTNNIKQLVTALTNFDGQRRELPGYVNDLEDPTAARSAATGDLTLGRKASWIVMTFPFMELQNLYDQWNGNFGTNSAPVQEIEGLVCPSDPAEQEGLPWLSYVGNSGQAFLDDTRGSDTPAGTSDVNTEYAANGVFLDNSKNEEIAVTLDGRENQPPIKMSLSYIQSNDGQSKTLWVTENVHAWYWCIGTPDSSTNPTYLAQDDGSAIADAKHMFGFVWSNQPTQVERINGDKFSDRAVPPDDMEDYAALNPGSVPEVGSEYESYGYPTSKHPGGVNAAFCDGHIVFIQENVDPTIYAMLMTSNNKRSKFYDKNLAASDPSRAADRFLQQPSDADY